MKVLLQRVIQASVNVNQETVGRIGKGYLLLSGIAVDDEPSKLKTMAEKIVSLRLFPDDKGRFHHTLAEVRGEVLVIPQFTLFADTSKGRRPEFFKAMKPPQAEDYFQFFVSELRDLRISRVEKGIFGADMQVSLISDGPVTIPLDI